VLPVLVILVAGALDMWRRGTSFHWGTFGAGVGALAGAVALAVAWVTTGGWAEDRDPVALLALAVATELALRGWLVERIYRGGIVVRRRSRTGTDDLAGSRTAPDDAARPPTSAEKELPRRGEERRERKGFGLGCSSLRVLRALRSFAVILASEHERARGSSADHDRGIEEHADGSPTNATETRAVLAVLVGAIAEALLTPGNLTARIGAGAFGAGLGWMYVRAGLMAPVAARLVFVLGGLALQLPW
jgi:hypothetical protein